MEQLRLRLAITNISSAEYSGHCFRLVAAHHASDNGILDDDIQKLACWSSENFHFYFTTSAQTLYNLNINFQTRRLLALPRVLLFL